MMKQSFETLGLDIDKSISITELLGENFNPGLYQMNDVQKAKIKALREIIVAYINGEEKMGRMKIENAKDAVKLMNNLRTLSHEEVWMVLLDKGNRVISKEYLFTGSIHAVALAAREVIAKALSKDAASLILYHNHPSGLPEPSSADINQTRALKQVCTLMDLQLLDHIIIASGSYYSFANELTSKF